MNVQRYDAPRRVFSYFVFALIAFTGPLVGMAQQKTDAATPQAEPVPTKSAPASSGQISSQRPGANTGGDDRLLINTDLITLNVTVTDIYGRYVTGLNKSAFTITDQKQPQEITFFSDDDAPVSVGVLFDVSGSMSGDKIMRARDALKRFIETSH